MAVPVLNQNNQPLFPCKERRARCLLKDGRAIPYWQKGIFCIKLTGKESEQREVYPEIALGIDPGSKREGYTILTEKSVVLNVTTDTKSWIKKHLETRRILRRTRRQRNTPYRKCRLNRLRNRKRLPPSTRERWNTKLQMIKFFMSILPITTINVEDIKAKTIEGKKDWNTSFSPLEQGKNWFYSEVRKLNVKLNVKLILTQGYETKLERDKRGFSKTKGKLDWIWEAHNVDSHILAEIALKKQVKPFLGLWKIEFLQFYRRVLHVQNPKKNGFRKLFGGTVSLGMSRGSVVRYKSKLGYLGGSYNGRATVHNIITKKRVTRDAKIGDVKVMYTNNRRVQFLSCLKTRVSMHN